MKHYNITQREREADVYIFGDISEFGGWGSDQSADSLIRQIEEMDADVINLHIDSFGGSVKEGWGMYNALKKHKATVNTYADGFVASAALYPYLAGDKRYAFQVSAFYLHEMSTCAGGYASDLRAAADDLDKLTEIGVQAFVESAGMDRDEVLELMKAETWLDPAEALEKGICTSIISAKAEQKLTQSVRRQIVQALTAKPTAEPKKETNQNIFAKMFTPKGD